MSTINTGTGVIKRLDLNTRIMLKNILKIMVSNLILYLWLNIYIIALKKKQFLDLIKNTQFVIVKENTNY
jgi:hypothetical protein